MYNDVIFQQLFDVYRMGIQFGLLLGFPAFLLSWGFSIVVKLFTHIAK